MIVFLISTQALAIICDKLVCQPSFIWTPAASQRQQAAGDGAKEHD